MQGSQRARAPHAAGSILAILPMIHYLNFFQKMSMHYKYCIAGLNKETPKRNANYYTGVIAIILGGK
jgi:hypothetical protein